VGPIALPLVATPPTFHNCVAPTSSM